MVVRVPINGSTLQWARETMCVDQEELARAADTKAKNINSFETGEASPTMRQLEKIAKKLDRTLAFFFIPPPAESDVPETADFRGYAGGPIPYLLAREMRRAEQYRETILELEGAPKYPVLTEQVTVRNAKTKAAEMRNLLDLQNNFIPPGKSESQTLNFWRSLLESHGILVFQASKIGINIFRGLSIYHEMLPIILLNGADSYNGKIFTLFHELAHIVNHTSGMCSLNDNENEEYIANIFSANFLMPEELIDSKLNKNSNSVKSIDQVEILAKQLKVSSLAAGVRLHTLGYISEDLLESIRTRSDKQWKDKREQQKEKPGGPPHWKTSFRNLGSGYIGTIARALEDQKVDWLDASYLLNEKIPTVKHLVDEYYRTEG